MAAALEEVGEALPRVLGGSGSGSNSGGAERAAVRERLEQAMADDDGARGAPMLQAAWSLGPRFTPPPPLPPPPRAWGSLPTLVPVYHACQEDGWASVINRRGSMFLFVSILPRQRPQNMFISSYIYIYTYIYIYIYI